MPESPAIPRRQAAANLARRAKLLRFHARMRGQDGKSISAVRGGHARMGADPSIARAAATEMALQRWYPKGKSPSRQNGKGDGAPQKDDFRGSPHDTY